MRVIDFYVCIHRGEDVIRVEWGRRLHLKTESGRGLFRSVGFRSIVRIDGPATTAFMYDRGAYTHGYYTKLSRAINED